MDLISLISFRKLIATHKREKFACCDSTKMNQMDNLAFNILKNISSYFHLLL